MSSITSITYPNALHFTLTSPNELYDLYITVLERTQSALTIELWCPQTTLFNIRTTIPYSDESDMTAIIHSFLNSHLHQIGFDCNIDDL